MQHYFGGLTRSSQVINPNSGPAAATPFNRSREQPGPNDRGSIPAVSECPGAGADAGKPRPARCRARPACCGGGGGGRSAVARGGGPLQIYCGRLLRARPSERPIRPQARAR